MILGSKVVGQKPVVVRKTEKLEERQRKALFPSEGKGHDDDDDETSPVSEIIFCALRFPATSNSLKRFTNENTTPWRDYPENT